MAVTVRTGKVWLLTDIPFDKAYNHTKYFSSATAQFNWICHNDHIIGTSNPKENQNQIKDPLHGSIRVSGHQENYLGCSYICFQNTSIDGSLPSAHTYNYAFVDDVRYLNNAVMEIDYTIDVFQTYLFQGGCTVGKAYIRRTHTQSDDFGEHIEPEPLSSDRYVFDHINKSSFYDADVSKWSILMYASKARSEGDAIKSMGIRCGLPQGLYCNVWTPDPSTESSPQTAFEKFTSWMNGLSGDSYADWVTKIVAIVAVPSEFISASAGGLANTSSWNSQEFIQAYTTSVDGYTPKNKKLLTFPYNCHYMTTQDGNSEEIAYEFSTINNNGNMRFKCALAVQPQPELIIAPYGYKGYPQGNVNYDAKIVIKNFPMIPWVADAYKQYLGSQGMSNAYSLLASGVKGIGIASLIGGGVPTIGAIGAGAALSQINTYANQQLEGRKVQMGTDDVHLASNSAMLALGEKTVMHAQKCICAEDAQRFDEYLSRYGYAVNCIDSVHYTNPRFNQHYVQTSECIVTGGAPASVKDTIANAFNKGITFWKNNVGNYTL